MMQISISSHIKECITFQPLAEDANIGTPEEPPVEEAPACGVIKSSLEVINLHL